MSIQKEILEQTGQRLTEAGLRWVRHFPARRAERWVTPVLVLGLRKLELETGGFGDYLGMSVDEHTLEPCEVYGKRGTVGLAMDVYCSGDGQDAVALAEETLETAVETLLAGCAGLDFCRYRQEEAGFDGASGLYRIRAELEMAVFMTARSSGEAVEILDFRLGDITINV